MVQLGILTMSLFMNAFLVILLYLVIYTKTKPASFSYDSLYRTYNKNLFVLIELILTKKEQFLNIFPQKPIVIYGCGKVAEILHLLLKEEARIACFMESQKSRLVFNEIPVINLGDPVDGNSTIVISVLHDEAFVIKEKLQKLYPNPIMVLQEMFNEIS